MTAEDSLSSRYPNLEEWLNLTPPNWRARYKERAETLLKAAPDAGAVVLRVMLAERRLGLWAIRAERGRRRDKKLLVEALREMTTAEKDAARAWRDYTDAVELARSTAAGLVARQPVGGFVDLLGTGAPPVSAQGPTSG